MKTQRGTRILRRREGQDGYSLIEIMVAMAVFTIIVLAGLTIYDRSNRVFNQGVQSSDMQQSTRVAFDKLVSDVRLAGFDYDRDGIPFSAMAPTWQQATAYVQGNLVQPSPGNGHTYICIASGTSDTTQPTWPTGTKATVMDPSPGGPLKWQENGIVQYQQPDEQIEYAGEAALTIRANFDFESELGPCPTSGAAKECENGREQALESTQFPLVTTDNDEIVTYALQSNSGNSLANKNSIVFYADTDRPRDVNPSTKKKENTITISGVDTTNLYPPYTLWRYTLDNSGNPVGTPIADNIRSLRFHYYTDTAGRSFNEMGCATYIDTAGASQPCTITTMPYGNGQYDSSLPNQSLPDRDNRAAIKSVRVELVGMNANPDNDYTDAADTAAPHYRKYELDSLVVPRNIGKHGMREFSTLPPSAPEISTVCAGSCNSVYVTWQAPTGGGGVDSYNILYSPGDCAGTPASGTPSCTNCPNLTYSTAEDAGTNLAGYATKITPGQWYRFSVQALNKYGSNNATNCVAVNVLNKTTPAAPGNLHATGDGEPAYPIQAGGVQLTWPPVTTNSASANSTSCSDGTTKTETNIAPGESIVYRIWRSKNINFNPGDSGSVMVLSESSAMQPVSSGTNLTWNDATAPMGSCIDYFYRVQAVSVPCCNNPAMNTGNNAALAMSAYYPTPANPAIKGRTETAAVPAVPTGLGIGSQNCTGNVCDVTVTWNAVTKDTANNPMFIDGYTAKVYNSDGTLKTSVTTSGGATTATLNNLHSVEVYTITVMANDCQSGAESAPIYWPCNWSGGAVSVTAPVNYGGDGTAGNPWIIQSPASVLVTTANQIQKVDATVFEGNTQIGSAVTVPGPGTSFNVGLPKTDDGVLARVHVTLTSTSGSCALNGDYYVIDYAPPACSIKDKQTDSSVVTVTGASDNPLGTEEVKLIVKNTSTDVLIPKKLIVTFFAKAGSQQVNGYTIPLAAGGTSTVASTCNPAGVIGTGMITFPSTMATIASGQQNYAIDIYFNGNQNPFSAPGNYNGTPKAYNGASQGEVYLEYQTPFGDIKICRIYPSAGTTTEPSAACQ